MRKPDYRSRVDVFRRGSEAGPEPVAGLQGVTLAHAVETIIRYWRPLDRNDALVATTKGFLRVREIGELYARPDFPGRKRKRFQCHPRDRDTQ
jgi:hypothetical protein